LVATGCVERLLVAGLLDGHVDHDEIFVEDRLGFGGLDKPIEFLAPSSPGGVEDREDGALTLRGLGLSLA
jgi:hypothetical protein